MADGASIDPASSAVYRLGDLVVAVGPREVRRGDECIPLPALSFDLLIALLRAAPNVVTYDELMERVWPGLVVSPETITQRVKLVRNALGDDAQKPRYIFGVRGRGYRVAALAVEPRTNDDPARSAPPSARSFRNRWSRLALAALLVAAGGLAAISLRERPRPVADVEPNRVHIGDFRVLRGGHDAELFSDGLADTLARTFATNDFPTSAPSRDTPGDDADERAEFTVRGTITRDADAYVVTTEIVERRADVVLWSTSGKRVASEAAPFQVQFSMGIAAVFKCAVFARTHTPEAPPADFFSKFLRYCDATMDTEQFPLLPELARRLRDAYPQYSAAQMACAGANALASVGRYRNSTTEEDDRLRKEVYRCAHSALTLEPSRGAPYWAMALVNDPAVNWAERERLLQKSLSIEPEFIPARNGYASLLFQVGRIREAQIYLERALNDDPLAHWMYQRGVAYEFARTGNLGRAREMIDEAGKTWPQSRPKVTRFDLEHWFGDPMVARSLAQDPDVASTMPAGSAACLDMFLIARSNGDRPSEDEIDRACASDFHRPKEQIYGYFGHVDAALRELANRYRDYPRDQMPMFGFPQYWEPYMASVRADVRVMALAERYGLVDYWLETDHWPDFCSKEAIPYVCKEAALAARDGARLSATSASTPP